MRQYVTGLFFFKESKKRERTQSGTFWSGGKSAVVKQQLIGWAFSSGFGLNQVRNESGR